MITLQPLVETIKFLDISDDEYFGNRYKNYISNSKLSLINEAQGGSPLIYKEGLSVHNKYSDSLHFGSAVHALTLQPDDFVLTSINRPTAKMGFMADELYKYHLKGGVSIEDVIEASNKIGYYKDKMDDIKVQNVFEKCHLYWEERKNYEAINQGSALYLDDKSRDKLNLCLTSIESNQDIQNLLHPLNSISLNETTLLMDVLANVDGKEVLLSLKAKLDNFTINVEESRLTLNDLKTTGHKLSDFKNSFKQYFYNRQMAMYLWMAKLYVEKEYKLDPDMYANMLVVSTIPDYRSGVFKVYDSDIKAGFKEFIRLLKLVAYYEANKWENI